MKNRHSSPLAVRGRCRTALATGVALVAFASTDFAAADLAGEFADRITVDVEYVTGANNATDVAWAGDGRALVTRKNGEVTIRRTDGTVTVVTPFQNVDTASEKGLLGVVADPNADNVFYFYVSNGPSNSDKHRVFRGMLTEDDDLMIDENPIVGSNTGPGLEGPANHDGGGLIIHDGYLYVGVGDTGSNATPPINKYSSCLNKPNGAILRVGLDGSVPDDNPLVGASNVTTCGSPTGDWSTGDPDPRIFAWGFRNPFRFWIDPQTDLMWVGDVGETTEEEISIGTGDQHFGYPFIEGTVDHHGSSPLAGKATCTDVEPARDCVPAVHAYGNPGFPDGAAVTGGLIPEGCGWTEALGGQDLYLFGDSSLDWIRALPVSGDRTSVSSMQAIEFGAYNNGRPVSFRMGPDESLYVVLHGSGAVYKMTPTERTDCEPSGGGGAGGEGGTPGVGGAGGTGGGAGGVSPGGAGGDGPVPDDDTMDPPDDDTMDPPDDDTTGPVPDDDVADDDVADDDTTGPIPDDDVADDDVADDDDTGGPGPGNPVNPAPNNGGGSGPGPSPVGPSPSASGVAGGAGSGNVDSAGDDGGCGCRTVGHSSGGLASMALALGLGALTFRRRRRR